MDNILSLLGRFIVIVIGYGVAIIAAGFLLNALILAMLGVLPEQVNNSYNAGFWPSLLISSPFMALLIGYFAFWPCVIMIILSEYFHQRDSLFYTISGLVIGVVLYFSGYKADIESSDQGIVLMSMIAAGITGGFVYWLVAGRWSNISPRKSSTE